MSRGQFLPFFLALFLVGCTQDNQRDPVSANYDFVVRGGTIWVAAIAESVSADLDTVCVDELFGMMLCHGFYLVPVREAVA